jgi:hypothetical protein
MGNVDHHHLPSPHVSFLSPPAAESPAAARLSPFQPVRAGALDTTVPCYSDHHQHRHTPPAGGGGSPFAAAAAAATSFHSRPITSTAALPSFTSLTNHHQHLPPLLKTSLGGDPFAFASLPPQLPNYLTADLAAHMPTAAAVAQPVVPPAASKPVSDLILLKKDDLDALISSKAGFYTEKKVSSRCGIITSKYGSLYKEG